MAIVFQDSFTEGSNTTLASHVPDTGIEWIRAATSGSGTETLRVNSTNDNVEKETGADSNGVLYVNNPIPSTADAYVQITLGNAESLDDTHHLFLRLQDGNNFYAARFNGDHLILYKKVSGTTTALTTDDTTGVADGDVVRFEIEGTILRLFVNGILRQSKSDSALSANGFSGYGMGQLVVALDDMDAQTFDNYEVGDLTDLLFKDSFNDTTNTTLVSHTPEVGDSWTKVLEVGGTNSLQVVAGSSTLEPETGGLSDGVLYSADVTYPSPAYEIVAHMIDADSSDDLCILAVRIQDSNNMYALRFNQSAFQLHKKVGGVWSTISSDLGALIVPAAACRVYLRCFGTTISAGVDGVEKLSVTDSSITASGKAGYGIGAIITATDDMSAQTAKYITVQNLAITATFTADGVVLATSTKTFTADGIVRDTFTKTFTVDGFVSNRALFDTLRDNFDDNSLDTDKWDSFGYTNVTESNGRIEFNLDTLDVELELATEYNAGPIDTYDLNESYVKFIFYFETGADRSASIRLRNGSSLEVGFNITTAGNIEPIYDVGAGDVVITSVAYSTTTHKWLRIRNASGTIYWDYSSDGITWNNFGSNAEFTWINALWFYAYTRNESATPQIAYLDSFNVDVNTKTFTADGIVLATTTSTFTVDGKVSGTVAFTSDGVIKATNLLCLGELINEQFNGSVTGTLYGDAILTTSDDGRGVVRFTEAITDSYGAVEQMMDLGDNFDTTFSFRATGGSGADATYFYWGCTSTPLNEASAAGGYLIAFSEYHDNIQLNFNGSTITSTSQTGIDDGNWHEVLIRVSGNQILIYFDGTLKINYTDIDRTLPGSRVGMGARTGGATNEHLVDFWKVCSVFTVDGIVKVITDKTFTVDGLIEVHVQMTWTVDGFVKDTFTQTFTIDAVVSPPFVLGEATLPRPYSLERGYIYQKQDITTIDGRLGRDLGPKKEFWILKWRFLSRAEADSIMTEVNRNTAVNFRILDVNLTVPNTQVLPYVPDRSYNLQGEDYYEEFILELTQEEAT